MTRSERTVLAAVAVLIACACSACANLPRCDSLSCREDALITTEVRSLLSDHPALNANAIGVQTWNHVVYLYGLVDTNVERSSAEAAALGAKGALRVVDSIALDTAR
jgi:osmotically-inducible protein OsmY